MSQKLSYSFCFCFLPPSTETIERFLHAGPCFVMGSCSRYQSPTTTKYACINIPSLQMVSSVVQWFGDLHARTLWFHWFLFFNFYKHISEGSESNVVAYQLWLGCVHKSNTRISVSRDKARFCENTCFFFFVIQTTQDLKATNDNLKALQMELEKAYQTQNVGVSSSGTLTAILETKDARIATLEKEVGLLEQELDRMRLYAGSSGHALDRSVQFAAAPAFKHQVSVYTVKPPEDKLRMQHRRTSLATPLAFSLKHFYLFVSCTFLP